MANPQVREFARVKKLVRFLRGVGPVQWVPRMQSGDEAPRIRVYAHGQQLGWLQEDPPMDVGRSTVGGQAPVEVLVHNAADGGESSGEAELISMIEGGSRSLGLQTMTGEVGCEPLLDVARVHTDSAVVKSFVAPWGLGGRRNLEVKLQRLQEQ